MTLEECMKHFSPLLTEDEIDFIENESLLGSRYLVTRRMGKLQFAYCTHCRQEYITDGSLRYNSTAICSNCNSECFVKTENKGMKTRVDEAYTLYYQRSVLDPSILVARGIFAIRNYTAGYMNVDTLYTTLAYYVFKPGESCMYEKEYFGYNPFNGGSYYWSGGFRHCKSIFSIANRGHMVNVYNVYNRRDIPYIVPHTQFKYSTWENYQHEDMVKFFDLYNRYPIVEYLTKIGFSNLVEDKLCGHSTYSAINWNGKTIEKVFRLKKKDLKPLLLLKNKGNISFHFIKLYQWNIKNNLGLTLDEVKKVEEIQNNVPSSYEKVFNVAGVKASIRYVDKQYKKTFGNLRTFYSAFRTYVDYLNDCEKLNLDIKKENILFPSDLYESHQKFIKQIQYLRDKAIDERIAKRIKKLDKLYQFEGYGLIIRPAASSEELIHEGKVQDICIGGYAERYSKGSTDLLFIRRVNEPDKPFYAMEVVNGRIIQTRGLRNCTPKEPEVLAFIEAFEDKLQGQKREKNRVRVPA